MLDTLNTLLKDAKSGLHAAYRDSHEAQLPATIPGAGQVPDLIVVSETGGAGRFHSSRHLSSFAGLASATSRSGNRATCRHITRQDSPWLHRALIEAVIYTVRSQGPLRNHYLKLKRRKGNRIARVAAARKLSTRLYYMLRDGREFGEVTACRNGDPGSARTSCRV